MGFICTHNTTRLLLQGNSRSAKASSRPFKAEAVLESLERLLIQLRQLNRYLWPFFRDPCQMCLKGQAGSFRTFDPLNEYIGISGLNAYCNLNKDLQEGNS